MALIDVKNVSFRYGADYIFKNSSFQIDTNWKLAIVGRNGRGKTTFLKLLMKEYEYEGEIHTQEQFSYFPYTIKNDKQMTLDVIEELYPMYEYWKVQRECNLLGLREDALYQDFSTLSKGQQVKVMLLVLFLNDNAFVLIDEPTNHLDIEGREKVASYLKSKKGYILVSHDRNFIDTCADHILAINKNSITIQTGNFSSWYADKQHQDAREQSKNIQLQKEIKELNVAARRNSQWSSSVEKTKHGTRVAGLRPDRGRIGHKAAKMMQRAKNIERRVERNVEEKKQLLQDIEEIEKIDIPYLTYKKDQLLYLQDVSIQYGDKIVCDLIHLSISNGDKIAITGVNGSGKSSLLKLLVGENISYQGILQRGQGLIISYMEQSTEHLRGELSTYIKEKKVDETRCKTILAKLGIPRSLFTIPMDTYSEGQKKKVLLACTLAKEAHIYMFDEPLNYIDVFSRMQMEEMLKNSKATVVCIEHDSMFIKNCQMQELAL